MPNNSEDLINLLIVKRKELNITQNKLSKKVDVAHSSTERIENFKMNPTLGLFISIANELGYDVFLREIKENDYKKEPVFKDNTSMIKKRKKVLDNK